jgi:uncharacterized membrane protein
VIDTTPDADRLLPVRQVALLRPLVWLRLGWRDLTCTPVASLAHGVLVSCGGGLILLLGAHHGDLLLAAFTGFLLVGPILATGLYELSRLLARGERPGLGDVVQAWRRGTRPLVWLGLLLGAAASAWVLASVILFKLFVGAEIHGTHAFLRYVVLEQGDVAFTLWLVAGGLGAAVVFAATAVSPPLLLGRSVDLRCALLTSVRAVGENPASMALWAAIIMAAMLFSMLTLMLGFVVTVPLLGHATWHAYRDLVDTSQLPLRHR